jgi:hypothetical protein
VAIFGIITAVMVTTAVTGYQQASTSTDEISFLVAFGFIVIFHVGYALYVRLVCVPSERAKHTQNSETLDLGGIEPSFTIQINSHVHNKV